MKNKHGFTLAELIGVIVILSILVIIAIPSYITISKSVKTSQNKNLFSYLESQAEKYAVDNNIYNDSDITIINVETLLEQGYIDPDKITDNKIMVKDAFGKDITCYQIKIENINGKPVATFIEKNEEHTNDMCAIDYGDNTIEIRAYDYDGNNITKNLRENALGSSKDSNSKYYHLNWTSNDVVLVLNLIATNLTVDDIKEIKWDAVNETKEYQNNSDEWYTTSWLDISNNDDSYPNYSKDIEYRNAYRVSTSKIMNDTKFKVTVTLEYQENDKIVNKVVSTYIYVKIDRDAPTLSATVDENWTKSETKTIYLTGNDGNGSGINYFWIYDANNYPQECSSNNQLCTKVSLNNKSNNKGSINKVQGDYKAYAVDKAGNASEHINISVGHIDNSGPTCIYDGESTEWINGTRMITVKCDDGEGSGCVTKPKSYSETTNDNTIKSNGSLSSVYTIKDRAGNKTICGKEVNIYIDKTKPILENDENKNWTKENVTINYECKDTGSGCETILEPVTYTTSAETISYKYTLVDKAGNANSGTKTINVYIDKTKPTVKCTKDKKLITITATDKHSGLKKYIITSKTKGNLVSGSLSGKNQTYTYTASFADDYTVTIIDAVDNSVTSETINIPTTEFAYTITYSYNNTTKTQSCNYGSNCVLASNNIFTRTGYSYSQWLNGSSKLNASSTQKDLGDITLTPIWVANKYTVSFGAAWATNVPEPITVTYNSKYGTLPVPSGNGYVFNGWYDSKGNNITADSVFSNTSNITLYARGTLKVIENGVVNVPDIVRLAQNGCVRNHYYASATEEGNPNGYVDKHIEGEDCSSKVTTGFAGYSLPTIYGYQGGGKENSTSGFNPGVNIAFVISPLLNGYEVTAEMVGYTSKRNEGNGKSLDGAKTTIIFSYNGGSKTYENVYNYQTLKVTQTISSSTYFRIQSYATYNSNSGWAPHGFGGISNLSIEIK